jgi:GNAT superfamily N-acetyltransferase
MPIAVPFEERLHPRDPGGEGGGRFIPKGTTASGVAAVKPGQASRGGMRTLGPTESSLYRDHLMRLDRYSRHARYHGTVSDTFIAKHAQTNVAPDSKAVVIAFFVGNDIRGAAEFTTGPGAELSFSIEKEWQGKGIGSALMEQALRAARERGIETLEVTTLPDNVAAQKLVRKFGAKLKLEDGVYSGTVETSNGDEPEDDRVAGDEEETGLRGNKGHKATIASRLVSAKGADTSVYRQPSIAAMKEDPKNFEHDMALFANADAYPNFRPEDLDGTADEIANDVKRHMKANLRFLWDNTPPEERELTKQWYDGARRIVEQRAKQYGLNDASVAGVYAALSPQKDWFQNVYLADRLIEIHQTQQATRWKSSLSR